MNRVPKHIIWKISLLVVLLILAALASLNFGIISISPGEVLQTFLGNGTPKQKLILFDLRMPTVILAVLVGAFMAVSGTILQGITRNELADPGILGINSGAGLAVVLYITFFKTSTGSLSMAHTFILPLYAFLGALLTAGLIVAIAWKGGFQSIRLVLVGVGINAGLSAILVALQLRLDPLDFTKAMVWLSGDLWANQWTYVYALLPWFLILIPYALYKAHTLNVLNLGTQVANGLGIRTNRERLYLLILAVALAGLGVSAGGGIAFLGLIAPHIARRLTGPKHLTLIPAAVLIGAVILLIAETVGRNVLAPVEIPAGIVVSIISTPYFIYLLLKTK